MMRVFVAAPHQCKREVREAHLSLVHMGIEPTATWHLDECNYRALTSAETRVDEAKNREAIRSSHAVLAIGRDYVGGEMFAEAARALEWKTPIVWTGRRILTTWLPGVVHVRTIEEALAVLVMWRRCLSAMETVDRGRAVLWDLVQQAERELAGRAA